MGKHNQNKHPKTESSSGNGTESHSSAAAGHVKQRKLTKKNRSDKAKLEKVVEYFQQHHPNLVITTRDAHNNQVFTINHELLTKHHIGFFLGKETRDVIESAEVSISGERIPTDFDEDMKAKTVFAYRLVSDYVSALKSIWKDLKLPVPPDVDNVMDGFIKGYQDMIAKLKIKSKMKDYEGKRYVKREDPAVHLMQQQEQQAQLMLQLQQQLSNLREVIHTNKLDTINIKRENAK